MRLLSAPLGYYHKLLKLLKPLHQGYDSNSASFLNKPIEYISRAALELDPNFSVCKLEPLNAKLIFQKTVQTQLTGLKIIG